MIGHTAFINGLLAEVFKGFPQLYGKCQEICAQPPGSFHYYTLSIATDVTDATLGASDLLLGPRIRAGGTATLA